MDRTSSPEPNVLPAKAVLAVCAAILFAGYAAATILPARQPATPAVLPPADPAGKTAEP